MSHSIEIWREIAPAGCDAVTARVAGDDELPMPHDGGDLVVELSRRYPTLSRELAEYLAR
jgi:hypothetical protein